MAVAITTVTLPNRIPAGTPPNGPSVWIPLSTPNFLPCLLHLLYWVMELSALLVGLLGSRISLPLGLYGAQNSTCAGMTVSAAQLSSVECQVGTRWPD